MLAVAVAATLAPCAIGQAAQHPVPGYTAATATVASAIPVHVVATNSRLQPQLAYGYQSVAGVYSGGYPGMSMGQSVGVDLAGGLIAGAIINGAMYAEAKSHARDYFEPIRQAGCDLPVDEPMQQAILAAVRRSTWGTGLTPGLHSIDDGDIDDVVDRKAARHTFTISTSLSPDMSGLITSVQVEGFAPGANASADWQRKAGWRDELVIVSERLALPRKTAADSQRMLAEENARFAASGTAALVARVNAAGGSASRRDRSDAVTAIRLNKRLLKEARQPAWTPRTEALRRSQLWAEDGCGRLKTALLANAAALGGVLDGLYALTLPERRGADDRATPVETVGQRNTVALPGGVYLSRVGGEDVQLGFRHVLLKGDD